jgi:hypothetical protein
MNYNLTFERFFSSLFMTVYIYIFVLVFFLKQDDRTTKRKQRKRIWLFQETNSTDIESNVQTKTKVLVNMKTM